MLTSDAKTPALYEAAIHYAALGYAVIPVYGNMVPARAKVAATDWGHFQHQRPTEIDLKRWFQMYTMGGLALITGRISQLLVLDFDSIDIHHQFVAAFPHLCHTYVVTSAQRRLPHYYYRLPNGMEVASRKIVGLDLLAEGRYVVAAPTQIVGQSYVVTQELEPFLLSVDDVQALIAFMENLLHPNQRDTVTKGTLSTTPSSVSLSAAFTDASHTVTKGTVSVRLAQAASVALNTLRLAAKEIIADADGVSSALSESSNVNNRPVASELLKSHGGTEKTESPIFTNQSKKDDTSANTQLKYIDTVSLVTVSIYASTVEMAKAVHTVTRGTVSPEHLIQKYQQMADQLGRNEALFRMGVQARDFGWSQADVESILMSAHVSQPGTVDHSPETPHQRIHEAKRTIASVYTRPARKVQYSETQVGLPVSVREALLKLKQMPLLRVLDGLILKGIAAGACLTEKFVTTLLEKIVGRHSVLKALKAVLPDGSAAFIPSPRTPTHTDVADEVTLFPGQKMLFVGVTESNKNRRGRPEQAYEMPSIMSLCQALGVRYTASDPISAEDLTSTRRTRQAIHRELLRRRPGLYSRVLLARRLGVSVRSVQRYHRSAGVLVRPAYRQREIFWETLSCIPEKDDQPAHSAFFQDDMGKRYPLDISLARWLLTRKKRVFLMYQLPNHYSVLAENAPVQHNDTQLPPRERAILRLVAAATQAETTIGDIQIAACSHKDLSQGIGVGEVALKAAEGVQIAANMSFGSYAESKNVASSAQRQRFPQNSDVSIPQGLPTDASWCYMPSVSTRRMGTPSVSPVPAGVLLFTPKPTRSQRFTVNEQAYRQPLLSLDVERAAQRLYDVLRRRCTERVGYMTLAKARQLLDQFGTGAVKRATHLLETRGNVQNPAGFLISVLRSNARLAGVLA